MPHVTGIICATTLLYFQLDDNSQSKSKQHFTDFKLVSGKLDSMYEEPTEKLLKIISTLTDTELSLF